MVLLYTETPNLNNEENKKVVILDGLLLNNFNSFYSFLKTELRLDKYFGENLDALADVLTDLPHLEVEELVFILTNQEAFLKDESAENKQLLLETLIFSVDEVDLLKEESILYETPYLFLYLAKTEELTAFLNDEAVPYELADDI
jgi:RNAse (barnase) inhibitor barstar